jgi:hypothetical protein
MKVRNQERQIVYTGELSVTKQERTAAATGLASVFAAVKSKEISLPEDQFQSLQALQKVLLDLKLPEPEKSGKDKPTK